MSKTVAGGKVHRTKNTQKVVTRAHAATDPSQKKQRTPAVKLRGK